MQFWKQRKSGKRRGTEDGHGSADCHQDRSHADHPAGAGPGAAASAGETVSVP